MVDSKLLAQIIVESKNRVVVWEAAEEGCLRIRSTWEVYVIVVLKISMYSSIIRKKLK